MKIEQIEFRDPETGTIIKPQVKLLICDCGQQILLKGGEVFPNTKAIVESYIKRYTYEVGTYLKNCPGKRYNQEQLDLWTRIDAIT